MKHKTKSVAPANLLAAAKEFKKPYVKPGRQPVLSQHVETIRYLRSARKFNYKQVHAFFEANGVKTSYQNLLLFVKKNKIGR